MAGEDRPPILYRSGYATPALFEAALVQAIEAAEARGPATVTWDDGGRVATVRAA